MSFFVGIDLGKQTDHTAVAVLEQTAGRPMLPGESPAATYAVRHLERIPLGTAYTQQVKHLAALLSRPPLPGSPTAVDYTGPGAAVFDHLLAANPPVPLTAVTITSGTSVAKQPDGSYHVAKSELVSLLQVLIQTGRLVVSPKLAEADALKRELAGFQMKYTKAANMTFSHRDGENDDLVLACMLGAWLAEMTVGSDPAGIAHDGGDGSGSDRYAFRGGESRRGGREVDNAPTGVFKT